MACSKARQAFLGLVLHCLAAFVLISRVKGDTLCFACDKIFHPAACGDLVRCGPHEVCSTVKGTSSTSSDEEFKSGCMAREDCQGLVGSNIHPFHTELCSQCCHSNLCNAYLCEQRLPPSMICASCSEVSDVDKCLKVAFCHNDEMCSSKYVPQSNTFTLGCLKKEDCTDGIACCNNTSLCNLNLTKANINPGQVSGTSNPSTATSWPSTTDRETIARFESSVGVVDQESPTTRTFLSSFGSNATSEVGSLSSLISTLGDLDTSRVSSTLGVTGSQDVTSDGSLSLRSTGGWSRTASETSTETQFNNTIPSLILGGESLCYSCDQVPNPVICRKFKVCGPHETCFTEKWLTSRGAEEFSSGCVAREECHDTELVRGHMSETVVCSDCCYGDLCNSNLCKAEVIIPKTHLLCAVCKNVTDLHACLEFSVCTAEVCAAEQTAGGFTLGCRKTEDCTGDVVCCNDTDLCNVKGGSNIHAPSAGKATLPVTPVSISVPPTNLFLSSTPEEQSSTSLSNTDTSSLNFSTSANSPTPLGTQSLPVETSSIDMTSPGDVTVAGTISRELSTASPPASESTPPEHYETSPESSYSESPTTLTTSGQQSNNITTETIEMWASLTSASNGFHTTSSSLAVSSASETTYTLSSIIENLSTTTVIAFLENFSTRAILTTSTGASEIISSPTRVIEISVSAEPYSHNLSVVESTTRPNVEIFSSSSSKESQISTPSTAAIEISTTSTKNSEISTLSTGTGEATTSFPTPVTVSVSSTDKSEVSKPSTKGIEISSTEAITISSSTTGANKASASAEPYKNPFSSAQSNVEIFLPSSSEVSMITTPTTEANGASASTEPSSLYFSVKESTAQSSVENYSAQVSDLFTSSTENSAIPTPSTGVIEVTVSPTKVIEISAPSTKSIDISTSFTVTNEISVSAKPYSQHFPLQGSSISVFSAKASDVVTLNTEAIEVSAPSSIKGSEISVSSTEWIDISAYSTQTNEILASSSLPSSSGESISQSIVENPSVSSPKASDTVSVPSTKEIDISTPSTAKIKISVPFTASNDISTSFTVANEISTSAEPYRQHLSVEESTAPSSVKTSSVSSAIISKITTSYSGAIGLSSFLSTVETKISSFYTEQTKILVSSTQATKISSSREHYSLNPSVEETTVYPLVENLSVSSAKESDTATPSTQVIEVSAPFSTAGNEISTPSTAGFDILTGFTQTNILVSSSLYPSAGESISKSLEESLLVSSSQASDNITTPSTGTIKVLAPSIKESEISAPSSGENELSALSTESNILTSFSVTNEISASAEPYSQHLSVEESTAPLSGETFSVSSAIIFEVSGISAPFSTLQIVISTSFTGQFEISTSSAQTSDIGASEELDSLHPYIRESLAHPLEENLSVSSVKASDTSTPSTEAIEVSTPFSIGGSEFSTPLTGVIEVSVSFTKEREISSPLTGEIKISSPSTDSNEISTSSTLENEISAFAESYSFHHSVDESTVNSLVENLSVPSAKMTDTVTSSTETIEFSAPFSLEGNSISAPSSAEIGISTSFTQTNEILELSSFHPVVGESSLQSVVENSPMSSAKASDIKTPYINIIEVSVLSTKEIDISTPSTETIKISETSTESNDISASFTVANEISTSAEPYRQHLSVEESTAPSSLEPFSVSSAITNEITTVYGGAIEISAPFSSVKSGISTSFIKPIEISASSKQPTEILVSAQPYSQHFPFKGSTAPSSVLTLSVSSAKASDAATPPTDAIEASAPLSIGGTEISTPFIYISTSFTQTNEILVSSILHPSVRQFISQSVIENMSVSSAKESAISTSSTGLNQGIMSSTKEIKSSTSLTEEIEISTTLTEEIKISAPSSDSNYISWSSTLPNEILASAEPYNNPFSSVKQSTAQSSVENFLQLSSEVSKIATPTTEANGASASTEPSSLYFSVKESTAQSSVENYSDSLPQDSDISTSSTGKSAIPTPSTGVTEVLMSSTKEIEIATVITGEIEILESSTKSNDISESSVVAYELSASTDIYSLYPSVGESTAHSLVENPSVSSAKPSDIKTPSTLAIEVSVSSTKVIEISAPSADSIDISTSFTVTNEISVSAEPYSQHFPLQGSSISVFSAKASDVVSLYTEAIEVSAPSSAKGSEISVSSTERIDISAYSTGEILVSSSLPSSAGESISQSLVENMSVSSPKASDMATPNNGATVSVPSTKEIGISTPSTEKIKISAPSTDSNYISTTFTVANEISTSAEPYRQHLSVEESTAPLSVETSSVSSAIIRKMTTSYSGAIGISSPLSKVETKISSFYTEQTEILESSTHATKISSSREHYSLNPSVEETTVYPLVENLSVSSAKESDTATPSTQVIEVSAPFSTAGNEISTPSTAGFDILTGFTQTNILVSSSLYPSAGESISKSLEESLLVSSSQASDNITTPFTGMIKVVEPSIKEIEISTPSSGENELSALSTESNILTSFSVTNEISASAEPYSQHLSVEESTAPLSGETFSVSSAIIYKVSGISAPFSTLQIVISTSFTGQFKISTSSAQTSHIVASEELDSLHPYIRESLAHPLDENLSVSSVKASDTSIPSTEAIEVSAPSSIGGSEFSTPLTGVIEVSVPFTKEREVSTPFTGEIKTSAPSTDSNEISASSTYEISAFAESYSFHQSVDESAVHSLVENLSVPSAKITDTVTSSTETIEFSAPFSTEGNSISAPSRAEIGISTSFTQTSEILELSSFHPVVGESSLQSVVENSPMSSANASDIKMPYINIIDASILSTKEIDISTPSTEKIKISETSTESNDISTSFTVANEISTSAEPYRQHLTAEESTAPLSLETFSVSSAITNEITTVYGEASEVSAPFSSVKSGISTSFIEPIEISVSSTQTTEILVSAQPYSQHFPFKGSTALSSVLTLPVSSAKASDAATPPTDAIEVSAPLSTGGTEISTPFIYISTSFIQTNEILVSSTLHPLVGQFISQSVIENLSVSSAKASAISRPSTGLNQAFVSSTKEIKISTSLTEEIKISAPSTDSNYFSLSSTLLNEILASAEPYRQHLSAEESTAASSVENISMSSAITNKMMTLYIEGTGVSVPFSTLKTETSPSPIQSAEISASAEPDSQRFFVEQSTAHSNVENYFMSSATISKISASPTESIGVSSPSTGKSAISTTSTGVVEVSLAFTKESEISLPSAEELKISVPSTVAHDISTSFTGVNEVLSSAEASSQHFSVKEFPVPSSMENFSVFFAIANETAMLSTRASAVSAIFPGAVDVSSPFSTVHSMMSIVSTQTKDILAPSTGNFVISESAEPYSIHLFHRESTTQPSVEILSESSAEASKNTMHSTRVSMVSAPYTQTNKILASSAGPNEVLTSWMTAGNEISASSEPYTMHPFIGESTAQSNVSSETQTTTEVSLIQKELHRSSVPPERQTIADLFSTPLETQTTTNEKQTSMEAFSIPAERKMTTETAEKSSSPAVTLSYYDSSDRGDTWSTVSSAAPEDSSISDAGMSSTSSVAPYDLSSIASEEHGSSEPPATSDNTFQQQVSEASSNIPSFSASTQRDLVTSPDISGSSDDLSVSVFLTMLSTTSRLFGVSPKRTASEETSPIFYTPPGMIEGVTETSGQLTTSSISKELKFTHQTSENIQSVTSPDKTDYPYRGQPPGTSLSSSEPGFTTNEAVDLTELMTLLRISTEHFDRNDRVPLSTEPSKTKSSFSQTDASAGQSSLPSIGTSAVENVTSTGSWLSSAPQTNFNTFSAPQPAETAEAHSLVSQATLPPTFGDFGGTSERKSQVTLNRSFSNGLWIVSTFPNSGSERVTERQTSQSDRERTESWASQGDQQQTVTSQGDRDRTGSWPSHGDQQETRSSMLYGTSNLTSESAAPPGMTETMYGPSQGEILLTERASSSNEPASDRLPTNEYTATVRDSSEASKRFSGGSASSGGEDLFRSATRGPDEDSTSGAGASELFSGFASTDLEANNAFSDRQKPVTLASIITTNISERLLANHTDTEWRQSTEANGVTAHDAATANGTDAYNDTVTQNDTRLGL